MSGIGQKFSSRGLYDQFSLEGSSVALIQGPGNFLQCQSLRYSSCLGQEDHLQKEMANHSSVLAWEIPWTEEPGGLQLMGVPKEWDMTEQLSIA